MHSSERLERNIVCKHCGERNSILAVAEAWYEVEVPGLDKSPLGRYGAPMDRKAKPLRYFCDGCNTTRKTLKGMTGYQIEENRIVTPKTNIEAWKLVRKEYAAGLTRGQIAAKHNISYQMVCRYIRMSQPAYRPLGFTKGPNAKQEIKKCSECREAAVHRSEAALCAACTQKSHKKITEPRINKIKTWTKKNGYIPTVSEAARILNLSRSRAGDIIKLAFGADNRPQGPQRRQRRQLPNA